ncbi:alpha/beta fold hydrolase [Pararhodobacter zhoushanensis]|uniref:alpha/beta fold hydrolase n=1 Tax=Pararhodobacter zhoushanensis TaxID=2479545 RepID=UPI0013DF27F8|nr:alpha/beta hydrolase [Pararhodobacter zhoushanensis]
MARIILVHGAWGNAKSWAAVEPLLTEAGHQVEALDLPGHGRGAEPSGEIGQAAYVDYVEARLLAGPPALLVGHSMGGIVIAQVASRQPEQVRACVFVTALLPRDGESLLGLIRQQATPGVMGAVRKGPVLGTTVLDPAAAEVLFPDATAKAAALAMSAMSVQSDKAQKDKAVIGPGFASVPRAYVFCDQDLVVTPVLQRQMVAATPCEAEFTLHCGHAPMLTQPKALAEILLGLAVG